MATAPRCGLTASSRGEQSWSHVGVAISPVPVDRELRFECQVRGHDDGQKVSINVFGYDKDQDLTFMSSTPFDLTNGKWIKLTQDYVVPPGTTSFTAWIINSNAKPISVSDAHLRVGGPKKAGPRIPKKSKDEATGPARSGAARWPRSHPRRAQAAVAAQSNDGVGVLTFPIPGTYRDQVPLTFDLHVEPPTALKSFRWVRRPDLRNWLCEVTVAPTKEGPWCDGRGWSWSIGARATRSLARTSPKLPRKPSPGREARRASRVTIRPFARRPTNWPRGPRASRPTPAALSQFTSHHQGKPGAAFDALDARKGLDCGGSCTSRANLAAALLRARGIPARTVAHLPTWSGPLYEHWLVEYWHPGAGWVWLESSQGKFRPLPCSLVVLNVANPEDEDRAFDPLQCRQVMPGAPHLSVHVGSEELHRARSLPGNSPAPATLPPSSASLNGTDEELAAAVLRRPTARLKRWSRRVRTGIADAARTEAVRNALESKKATELAAALQRPQPNEK